jgi:hypothetical protein
VPFAAHLIRFVDDKLIRTNCVLLFPWDVALAGLGKTGRLLGAIFAALLCSCTHVDVSEEMWIKYSNYQGDFRRHAFYAWRSMKQLCNLQCWALAMPCYAETLARHTRHVMQRAPTFLLYCFCYARGESMQENAVAGFC